MTAVVDLGVVVGLFVAAAGCGLWLLDAVRLRGPRVQHLLIATGLGLGLLGYVIFALGMAGLLSRPVIAAAYVACLILGLWGGWRFQRAWAPGPGEFRVRLSRLSWPAWALAGLLGLVAAFNMLAALAPVIGVDELIYRLAAADLYLRHERLFYIPSMWLHQQPQHVQMIQLWGMGLASDSTAQVVQWGMGVLLVAALIDFGRRVMPLTWALLGAAIFYSYSDVIVLSGRASPDLANGLFMALSLLAWMRWLETRTNRWLAVSAVLMGLFAAGARVPGAYGIVALAVLVGISARRHARWPLPRAYAWSAGVAAVAFLVVLPWYGRSYVQTGSPVWPLMMPVFGARDWTPAAYDYVQSIQERAVGPWLSLRRIVAAPWDLFMAPGRFNSGVVGPLILATLPLGLWFRPPPRLSWALAASAVIVPFWYVSYPRLRALIAVVGLVSMVSAYLLWQVTHADALPRATRNLGIAAAGLWLAVGLGTAVRFNLEPVRVALGAEPAQTYLSRRLAAPDIGFYWYDDYQALNRLLPAGSRLLIYDSRPYYLAHDSVRYDLLAKREPVPDRLHDPDYVAGKVRELGSQYVVLWPTPVHATGYAPSNWLEDTLHVLCRSRWAIVYRSRSMIVCRTGP